MLGGTGLSGGRARNSGQKITKAAISRCAAIEPSQ
jgi:hypothetical protein